MPLSMNYSTIALANARLSICAPVLAIGMSVTHLTLQTPSGGRVQYADCGISCRWLQLSRVREMAEEFPHVEFRGLDLGA